MLNFLKKEKKLLIIQVGDKIVCGFSAKECPAKKEFSIKISDDTLIEFIDRGGLTHKHTLNQKEIGWFHFSVSVQANLGCCIDCVITQNEKFNPKDFTHGSATSIRFQPFFISGSAANNDNFIGRGLFKRGLHFGGVVSNSKISLSCICDFCRQSFRIKSYHSGFNLSRYFYSASGMYTLDVSDAFYDPKTLTTLEASLPRAPDGSEYRYMNSFRCPHCHKPYIDFQKYPEERNNEYYGNYLMGTQLLKYSPQP